MQNIKARVNTFLKKEPIDSAKLPPGSVSPVSAGKVYPVASVTASNRDWSHLQASLGLGAGNWWIFARHWELPQGVDARCVAIVKEFEGCKLEAYICPAGIPTIGYGRTAGVRMGDRITRQQAEIFLSDDLNKFQDGVQRLIKVPLTASMKAALISFAYNVGLGAFGSSTLLRLLNSGDYRGAAKQFGRWVNGDGQVLPGLVRRRNSERDLFWADGNP